MLNKGNHRICYIHFKRMRARNTCGRNNLFTNVMDIKRDAITHGSNSCAHFYVPLSHSRFFVCACVDKTTWMYQNYVCLRLYCYKKKLKMWVNSNQNVRVSMFLRISATWTREIACFLLYGTHYLYEKLSLYANILWILALTCLYFVLSNNGANIR